MEEKKKSVVDGETKLKDAIASMLGGKNSRYPVYEENIDHIIGILHLKDAMRFHISDDKIVSIEKADVQVETLSKFNLDGSRSEVEEIVSNKNVIVQTANGVFLKFPLSEIPVKKKSAVGVRGIKLGKDDYIEDIFIMDDGMEFTMEYKGKKIDFAKMKMAHRDTKGIKVRV